MEVPTLTPPFGQWLVRLLRVAPLARIQSWCAWRRWFCKPHRSSVDTRRSTGRKRGTLLKPTKKRYTVRMRAGKLDHW